AGRHRRAQAELHRAADAERARLRRVAVALGARIHTLVRRCPVWGSGAAQMSEREGRKFFFLLQAFLAALFLIVGVALLIEAASGGYGIGLVIVTVMANGPG